MKESNQKPEEPSRPFSREEWKSIQIHRYYLSQKWHRYFSIEEAVRSWLRDYSPEWREKQMKKSSEAQLQEIFKHKWIESEKAGCDLGAAAAKDWIKNYAQLWRQCWEERKS